MNSKRITTIIVDDELTCIDSLSIDLNHFPEIELVSTCTSPSRAICEIIRLQPDLLFIDVEMPAMSGVELLKHIQPKVKQGMYVVFYTAYDKYWLDALRASAFDYLLKPYQLDELEAIITRLDARLTKASNLEQNLKALLLRNHTFAIQTVTDMILIKWEDVLAFQYCKKMRYWQMMLTDTRIYKLHSGCKAKELLDIHPCFVQISQDCILNITHLMSIDNGSLKCHLHPFLSDIKLVASQRYYKKLRERLAVL